MDTLYHTLIANLKTYFLTHKFRKGVLGLSGGIDSALTLKIAVDAVGNENVTVLIMPELGLTSEENITHAKKLTEFFKTKSFYQPINPFVTDFSMLPWKPNPRAQMNTKARIRAVLLYNFANTENALVLGTSNKSELMLGYATKYGDLAADVEVIGDLYKTEVYQLARHLGMPEQIIKKMPTAELAPGQTDEQDLGATYEDLDRILKDMEQGLTVDAVSKKGFSKALVKKVFSMVEEAKHKRQMPTLIQAHP